MLGLFIFLPLRLNKMKNIFIITSCILVMMTSCKSTTKTTSSTVMVEEEVIPVSNNDTNMNEIEDAKSFEIKMDSKIPVQSISIDTTKVKGANQARPK